jgi:AcrR family transcriptional regulator
MDRRATKTREHLIAALEQLIQIKDFDKLTIAQITEAADVNRATFYAHFLDKYDLLDATIAQNIDEQFERHELTLNELNEQETEKLFISMANLHMDYHTACTRGHETQYGVITKQLKMKIQQLLSMHIEETAAVLFSAMLVEAYEDFQKNRHVSAEVYYKQVQPILWNGLTYFTK